LPYIKDKDMKGFAAYKKFLDGKQLTRKEAILAQCYVCNGLSDGGQDCKGKSCPLYEYMPYRVPSEPKKKKVMSEEQKQVMLAGKQAAQNSKKKM